ncbi:MAG: CBS domain-containing protein [Gemmatimonadales bacterium]
MLIREVMTQDAECTRPEATVQEAARRMKELDVGSLPVCDNDRLAGIVTDRDIVMKSVAEGHDPSQHRVRDAMTPEIFYAFDDQDVDELTKIMKQKQIRRVPVLNREKRLVGIVSLGDLAVQGKNGEAGEALEDISEPAIPRR